LAIFAGEREDSISKVKESIHARLFWFFWAFEPFVQETGFSTALLVLYIFNDDDVEVLKYLKTAYLFPILGLGNRVPRLDSDSSPNTFLGGKESEWG
jgi:hypothetical protein